MNYFIFNYNTDSHYIDSFLEASALAHKHNEKKTTDWFNWKFRDNPFGETILACSEENGVITGCVGYGMQDFILDGKIIRGALSFETFVHPGYQGKGIFSKLIKLGEEEAKKRGVAFLVNFPNSNSLRGFLKGGWNQIELPEYRIRINITKNTIFSISDLKRSFSPNSTNFESLKFNALDFKQKQTKPLQSEINSAYLKWRFFSYPVSEYAVIEYEDVYSIVRIGKRGKLREGQVLFINYDKKLSIRKFIRECKKSFAFDILSFSISKSNPILSELKKSRFVKVPNSTNICFKILDDSQITPEEVTNISLSAINYHTY